METRVVPFQLETKAGGSGDDTFSGVAGAYLSLDWKGDIIDPGAFAGTVDFTKSQGKVRDEHATTTGKILDARDTAAGLWVRGQILPTSAGSDQLVLVKGGAIDRMSIGFTATSREWLDSPEAIVAYWESKGYTPTPIDLAALASLGAARLVTGCKVYEVSTTWLPVNENCAITGKGAAQPVKPTFADHSQRALAVLAEFVERAEKVRELRASDGRQLSAKSRAALGQIKARIDSLLSATEPEAPASVDDDRAIMDRFIAMGEALRNAP